MRFWNAPGSPRAILAGSALGFVILAGLPAASLAAGEPSVRILEHDSAHVRLEFALPELAIEPVTIGGDGYQRVDFSGAAQFGAQGEPELPAWSRLLAMPNAAVVSLRILSVETEMIERVRPVPAAPPDGSPPVADPVAYARPTFNEEPWVAIGDPALARDLRVVPICFRPVRCSPATSRLEVARRIEVQVDFGPSDSRDGRPGLPRAPSGSFARLYRNLVVGPAASLDRDDAPGRGSALSGACVYICPNLPDVVAALAPLVEWRRRKGFEVRVATTAETGTSRESIKAWLQNAYNTWEWPPEYITLVGDVDGAIALPCWYEPWSGYNGESDLPYGLLAGDDYLGDAHVGRISVSSLGELQLYVTKIVGYESTPYMADTRWYTRGCVVGDPGQSGYTCVQVMQWLKGQLLEHQYAEVDTIFTPPWVSTMRAKLNRGDTIFGYRGFGGMSGFEVGDILALQNGWKMPYAVNLTCLTGSYATGTSRSEAWIRAGIPPSVPTGGIASVGTATGGTHTRYNNCVTYGIWYGVFGEGLYNFGASLTRGKYELFVDYGLQDYIHACIFSYWNNLMGDAAGELWTAVPRTLAVSHPAEIAWGTNSLTISVSDAGAPCAGACVTVYRPGETAIRGLTGDDGAVELALAPFSPGNVQLTVTGHDCAPYLADVPIVQVENYVGYSAHRLDDDQSGSSSGNGDGLANPGEAIEIPVQVCNSGTGYAPAVSGRIECADPCLTIVDGDEEFGDVAPSDSAWCADDFDAVLGSGASNGHRIRIVLITSSSGSEHRSLIEFQVAAPEFTCQEITPIGFGERIDPGESGELRVRIANRGAAPGADVRGTLRSLSPWVSIADSSGSFGDIAIGGTGTNDADRFTVAAAAECYPGHIAPLLLLLESGAARDTVQFAVTVGGAQSDDPTGPDAYGYYAFDNTDAGYADAPTYAWVEIDPRYGGSGVSVGLTDFGDAQDDSRTLALPFPFTYYGLTHNEATICSNGWLALGSTWLTNYNNWNIPAAGAPPNMIAPMWDDLRQEGQNLVYSWYDAPNGRYVVQWSRLRNMVGGATENFQVILYDVSQHPTPTGDGAIVFQYENFTNSDYELGYATIGIENQDGRDGLMYGYYNYYNSGAAPIVSGRAIRFIASGPACARVSGAVLNASHGNAPIASAEVRVLETGLVFTTTPDGVYGGSVPAGTYTLAASHPHFAPDTLQGIVFLPGGLTTRDFALADVAGPVFSETTQIQSTSNTGGPYEVRTRVFDDSDVVEKTLCYRSQVGEWHAVPLVAAGGDTCVGYIPGQPLGTRVHYYVSGRDAAANEGVDPPGAPAETYWFWVQEPQFFDNIEAGAGTWTHQPATGGYADQWHRSSARNHTPGGHWSWKCGSTGSSGYGTLVDAALITEPLDIDGVARLSFWHWMDSEIFWYGDEYAFDGGRLEISLNGGQWTPIDPVGGYPYRVMQWQGGGPFPPGAWVYAGRLDWERGEFTLPEMHGTMRIRFRFGTDDFELAPHEGWYIDDVEIMLPGEAPSGARALELLPENAKLSWIAPNPLAASGGRAEIRFVLPQSLPVRLFLVDAAGRMIRGLLSETRSAGPHTLEWDGRSASGLPAPSGRYYCVLEFPGGLRVLPVVIVR